MQSRRTGRRPLREADFGVGSTIQHEWHNVWFIPRSGQTPAVILVDAGIGILSPYLSQGRQQPMTEQAPFDSSIRRISYKRSHSWQPHQVLLVSNWIAGFS